jgi:esterase/lipase
MRYLAAFFQRCGFRVMAILLPGHGTQPGDLLGVKWNEWAKSVAYGVDRLAEEADEICLGGLSAGAALSTYQSLGDERVRALFLFSPAFKVSPRAAYANLHRLYSWLVPSAKWVDIKPDRDIYKYESFPKNAAAQMFALDKELDARLHKHGISIPVFVAASEDDVTVDASATIDFFARARNPSSRLVLYTTDPEKCLSGNLAEKRIPAEKAELVNSVLPEQNIISYAHTSVVLPGNDPHYGVTGKYSNCVHYFPGDMEKYSACMARSSKVLQGEITEENLKAGIVRRLMYNPDFAALEASMQRFIDDLPCTNP